MVCNFPAQEARAFFEEMALPAAGHRVRLPDKDWASIYSVSSHPTHLHHTSTLTSLPEPPLHFHELCILDFCSYARTSCLSFPLQVAGGNPGQLIKAASTFKGRWVSGVADLLSKQNVLTGIPLWWSCCDLSAFDWTDLIFGAALVTVWSPFCFDGLAVTYSVYFDWTYDMMSHISSLVQPW